MWVITSSNFSRIIGKWDTLKQGIAHLFMAQDNTNDPSEGFYLTWEA